jgi:hypothetical protein
MGEKSREQHPLRCCSLFLFFFILFHPANPVRLFASFTPAGKILVHEGMEASVMTWL